MAAAADAMSALHGLMFKEEKWFDHYNFVNDIGHAENGIYALRAILGYGDLTLDSLTCVYEITSHKCSRLSISYIIDTKAVTLKTF